MFFRSLVIALLFTMSLAMLSNLTIYYLIFSHAEQKFLKIPRTVSLPDANNGVGEGTFQQPPRNLLTNARLDKRCSGRSLFTFVRENEESPEISLRSGARLPTRLRKAQASSASEKRLREFIAAVNNSLSILFDKQPNGRYQIRHAETGSVLIALKSGRVRFVPDRALRTRKMRRATEFRIIPKTRHQMQQMKCHHKQLGRNTP